VVHSRRNSSSHLKGLHQVPMRQIKPSKTSPMLHRLESKASNNSRISHRIGREFSTWGLYD
jgi:hypothetical protein